MDTWFPVWKSGCGWDQCPECAARIELEKQRLHEKAKTWPRGLTSEEQAAERERQDAREAAAVRLGLKRARKQASRARVDGRANRRVKRVLKSEQRNTALAMISKYRLHKSLKAYRADWLAEAWLELENPSVMIAQREAKVPFELRVRRAMTRARKSFERQNAERLKQVSYNQTFV